MVNGQVVSQVFTIPVAGSRSRFQEVVQSDVDSNSVGIRLSELTDTGICSPVVNCLEVIQVFTIQRLSQGFGLGRFHKVARILTTAVI